MATQEVLEDPSEEPTNDNSKKWILKVSIHCEGCKRKVKKILNQVEGVQATEIDAKQQKVTVTGNVDADTLLRKLIKSGKNAELWPENPDQKEKKSSSKYKKTEKVASSQQEISQSSTPINVKEVNPTIPVKVETAIQVSPKASQGDRADDSNGGEGGAAAKVGGEAKSAVIEESGSVGSSKTSDGEEVAKDAKKSDEKKHEGGSGGQPPSAEEKGGQGDDNSGGGAVGELSGGGGGGNDGGSGKKKKNKGKNGNKVEGEGQSSATEDIGGTPSVLYPDHHQGHPRHQSYDDYLPQYYGPPGPPAPPPHATVMSYNTSYPTSSYTASYYAPPPPNSYVYSYPGGPEVQAPPSDFDPYLSRQPLDSFELFSDENPNGCLIM